MIHIIKKHFAWRFENFYHSRHPHHHRLTHIIGDIILYCSLIVLVVSSLILSLWRPVAGASPYMLEIDELPQTITYYSSVPLTLRYVNTTRTHFDSLELEFFAPQNIEFTDKIIPLSPSEKNKWHTITSTVRVKGSVGSIYSIHARIKGTKNQKVKILGTLSFPLTIFSSHFTAEVSLPSVTIPEKNISGTIRITNPTVLPITGISLTIQTPKNFHIRTSRVKNFNLNKGETKTFDIGGYFDKKARGKQPFLIHTAIQDISEKYEQHSLTHDITLISAPITFNIRDDNQPLKSGKQHSVRIEWKNTSPVHLTDVTLGAIFHGELLDTKSISSATGIFDKKNTKILWSKKQNPLLHNVPPQSSGTLLFSFSPTPFQKITPEPSVENTTIQITPYSIFTLPESTPMTLYDAPRYFDITTHILPTLFARYYSPEGDQLGRGPLPPRVGQETKYFIFFKLQSTIHQVSDVVITTQLPPQVRWTGFVPQGKEHLLYHEKNRILTWQNDTISTQNTSQDNGAMAIFELEYMPTAKDREKNGTLLENIEVSGKDAVALEPIKLSLPPITTNLIQDKKAQTKGSQVQE